MPAANRTIDYTHSFSTHRVSLGLRLLSKFLVVSTVFLILAGSLVTSTGSGLSVPDWPNSYGYFMFAFPWEQMVGGIFYEHGHRLVASFVGLLTLILCVWLFLCEQRLWVKVLGLCALLAVVLQGVLGGLTVLFLLPTVISMTHAVLAQTFLCLTVVLAYSLSRERRNLLIGNVNAGTATAKPALVVAALIYGQLILGSLMRHTGAGLAIPDFPTMGGVVFPGFDDKMLQWINAKRFAMGLDAVTLGQILIHFAHRLWSVVVLLSLGVLAHIYRKKNKNPTVRRNIIYLSLLVVVQVILGAYTVTTGRQMWVASLHVLVGAIMLGLSVLLCLRLMTVSRLPLSPRSGERVPEGRVRGL